GFGGNGSAGNGQGQSCYTNDSNLPVPNTIAPVNSGTLVIGTICGSPAATAGMTAGSVITSVNGQAIGAPQTVHNALSKFQPGDTVSLTWVTPSGQHKTAKTTRTPSRPIAFWLTGKTSMMRKLASQSIIAQKAAAWPRTAVGKTSPCRVQPVPPTPTANEAMKASSPIMMTTSWNVPLRKA